jgi:AAA+ superfamily predicted ATPase
MTAPFVHDAAGRAVAMLLHMVFKLARTMAPSVIYIDEVEKVFVSDKKKAKEFGGQVTPELVAVRVSLCEHLATGCCISINSQTSADHASAD